MTKTLAKMAKYLEEHGPNEHRAGRTTAHIIPDIINQGQGKMFSGEAAPADSTIDAEDLSGKAIEPEDLME